MACPSKKTADRQEKKHLSLQKKTHLFFACPLTFAPAQPRFIVTFFTPVISFSSVSSQQNVKALYPFQLKAVLGKKYPSKSS